MNLDWIFPEAQRMANNVVSSMTGMGKLEQWIESCEERNRKGPFIQGYVHRDLVRDFNILARQNPEEVRKTLMEFTDDYNQRLEEFSSSYPKTLKVIWENYRRYSGIVRSFPTMGENIQCALNFGEVEEEHRGIFEEFIDIANSDEILVEEYLGWLYQALISDSEDFHDAGVSSALIPDLTLVKHDLDFMHCLGRYHFLRNGKEVLSIWDLSSKEVPRFAYS